LAALDNYRNQMRDDTIAGALRPLADAVDLADRVMSSDSASTMGLRPGIGTALSHVVFDGLGMHPNESSGPYNGAHNLVNVIATVGSAVGGEGFAAGSTGDQAGYPILAIDYNKYPKLAENIAHAQRAGYPRILTWQGNSNANRAAAQSGIPRGLQTIDEYPFAGTVEGGGSTWIGHIPGSQNSAQGGLITNFRRANNIQPGDKFVVCLMNYPGCL
jgi:hypothetical protein